jgi:hypothetical protein
LIAETLVLTRNDIFSSLKILDLPVQVLGYFTSLCRTPELPHVE